jgi:hypothetical protein
MQRGVLSGNGKRSEAGRTTQLDGDIERTNCSAADSEQGNIYWTIAGLSSENEVFVCK